MDNNAHHAPLRPFHTRKPAPSVPCDRQLTCDRPLPMGAHIVTPRIGYLHHGIYIGDGKVIHYAGLGRSMIRGPVEEVSISEFAQGRTVSIGSSGPPRYDCREVIRRAQSRIGEDLYRLWTNNCEHFCEWCLRGEHRSYQVEAWAHRAKSVLRAAARAKSRWIGGETLDWAERRSSVSDTPPNRAITERHCPNIEHCERLLPS